MKPLIIGVALTVILVMFMAFQTDNNALIRAMTDLKFQADDLAATGSLFYDSNAFASGLKVYDLTKANAEIAFLLQSNLGLNASYVPVNNKYWKEPFSVSITYFDDSMIAKRFVNGSLVNSFAFTYGTLYTEPSTSYVRLISEPTVIATINAGKPNFRLSFLTPKNAIQTSAYEYIVR